MTPTAKRGRTRPDHRRRLLAIVGMLLAERPAAEIKLSDICSVAGLPRSTVRYHFATASALVGESLAEYTRDLYELLTAARELEVPGQVDPIDHLSLLLDSYLCWIERNDRLWARLAQRRRLSAEELRLLRTFRICAETVLLPGAATADAPAATEACFDAIDVVIMHWLRSRGMARPELLDLLLEIAANHAAGRPVAAATTATGVQIRPGGSGRARPARPRRRP